MKTEKQIEKMIFQLKSMAKWYRKNGVERFATEFDQQIQLLNWAIKPDHYYGE